ncbi:hypothetical protein PTQ19_10460 [Microbacterium esteraromaticum]|nr:hypothetical protein [Microbacterium esteraromaticum]WDH77944.1 hypothetical protein PTQ19_10460 [Microbacterium esteraromaticum]
MTRRRNIQHGQKRPRMYARGEFVAGGVLLAIVLAAIIAPLLPAVFG